MPVNRTLKQLKVDYCDQNWHSASFVSQVTRIAALFHDFGKINPFFAAKLKNALKNKKPIADPFRHEWISLRLFEAFVRSCGSEDKDWIDQLISISGKNHDFLWFENVIKDEIAPVSNSPFQNLPPIAKLTAWLIVSHHRLPIPNTKDPSYEANKFKMVLEDLKFNWCYPKQYLESDSSKQKEIKKCWDIRKEHIPFNTPRERGQGVRQPGAPSCAYPVRRSCLASLRVVHLRAPRTICQTPSTPRRQTVGLAGNQAQSR